MVRLPTSLSILLLTAACAEDVTAPGICPEFCPTIDVQMIDTVLTGTIVNDSSYRGYALAHDALTLQLTTGGVVESRGWLRFREFSDRVQLDSAPNSARPVVAVDSFRLQLVYQNRSVESGDFEIVVHRVPVTFDSSTTFADLQPFFEDSTEIGAVLVSDTVESDTVRAILPADAFPTLEADSQVAAVGIELRSVEPAFVDIATINQSVNWVSLVRFVQVDSADGTLAARVDTTLGGFDTFVFPEIARPAPGILAIGGVPSSRALLRFDVPSYIVDSSSVVRATLILVPSEPVVGAPGDSIRVLAEPLAADIGPKSPVRQVPTDSVGYVSSLIAVGSIDTLRIDVTHIVAPWRIDSRLPRSLMLREWGEGAGIGEVWLNSGASAVGSPALQITYVPPLKIGN